MTVAGLTHHYNELNDMQINSANSFTSGWQTSLPTSLPAGGGGADLKEYSPYALEEDSVLHEVAGLVYEGV